MVRKPIVAGQFYPYSKQACIEEINELLALPLNKKIPEDIVAAIVPHAGWTFSGDLAAKAFKAIGQKNVTVDTFIIFGGSHGYMGELPAVYARGSWRTPLGEIAVDEDLADEIIQTNRAIQDEQVHKFEHSIEVQIPFIQHSFPEALILPIIVPPMQDALHLGAAVGDIITGQTDKKIVIIGSTDLTHYGPNYGFQTHGTGPEAHEWAFEVNDRDFIEAALDMDSRDLLQLGVEEKSACGPGAAAATATAAEQLGKDQGYLLGHTNSRDIMLKRMNQDSEDSVGYAAIVY